MPPGGLSIRRELDFLDQEKRLHLYKRAAILAARQRLTGGKQRQAADAQILLHGIKAHGRMVGGVAAVHVDRHRFAAAAELPLRVARRFSQIDAAVRR